MKIKGVNVWNGCPRMDFACLWLEYKAGETHKALTFMSKGATTP